MNVKKPLVIMAAVAGTFVLCQCSSEAPPPPDAPPAQLAEEYGLYRQDYCGCVFSRREAEARAASKSAQNKHGA